MRKLIRIKNVEYVGGYKLKLAFTNEKVKIVDLAYIFKGNAGHYFEPLRDLERFKEVYCDYETICWPNEADLCPDLLYKMGEDAGQPVKKRKRSSSKPKSSRRRKSKHYA